MKNPHWKSLYCVVLALILMGMGWTARGEESYSAETMRLLRYEGDVTIEDESGQPRFVMENVRFSSGETMITGEESLASVSLDSAKIVTLDANTRVKFEKDGSAIKLTLVEGALFLDVSEKLGDGESLDIQTSTMMVGIRGTILFVKEGPANLRDALPALQTGGPAPDGQGTGLREVLSGAEGARGMVTQLGVLEGSVVLHYTSESGEPQSATVSQGEKATLADTDENGLVDVRPEVLDLTREDVEGFVEDQVTGDSERTGRVGEVFDHITGFAQDGDWTWPYTVKLVAQSASKLYDGLPLTRSTDVLASGLPASISYTAAASGSQTDAGTGVNKVASYRFMNAAGEDITGHFPYVELIDGQLIVDPAPLTIWSASDEKMYDGEPLENPDAEIHFYPGYEKNTTPWRNTSYVVTESADWETMYGVSGVTRVHGTNPLTNTTREIDLKAGERVSVYLSDESDEKSIEFKVEPIDETQIPVEILRLYADNQDLLEQACADTNWDIEIIRKRIVDLGLTEPDDNPVVQGGLTVERSEADRLMVEFTNVRIHIDSDYTDYNNRALGGEEARFTGVHVDESIEVTAVGSQTPVGESANDVEITWNDAREQNYVVEMDLGKLVVTPNDTEILVTAESAEKVYDGKPLEGGGVTVTGVPEGFTYTAEAAGSQTDAGTGTNAVTSFVIRDREGKDVTEFFSNIIRISGALTVTPAEASVTTGSASKVYDGKALTSAEATITGLVNGETAAVTATGTITDVGTAENTYTIDWGDTNPDNYTITETLGKLEVTGNDTPITVSGGSAEKSYDGKPLEPDGVTVTGLPEGFICVGTSSGSYTDAGTYDSVVTEYAIYAAAEAEPNRAGGAAGDVTANFINITVANGTLTIDPAEVTVTTGSASKAYDGKALTSAEATITGLVNGETAAVTATGTITDVGTAENTYTIEWGSAKASNYAITENLGTLEITANDAAVTITAGSAEKVYDGKPLGTEEVIVTGLPEGFYCVALLTGSQTDAGSSGSSIDEYTICNAAETDVTGYFTNVTLAEGTLKVNAAEVTITTGSASKAYDGKALTSAEATITGLVNGETAAVTATGTITDVGTAENTYAIEWGSAKASNYAITENLGTLEITANNALITLTAGSAEKTYDGTPLTTEECNAEGLPAGMFCVAEILGSQTDAGSSLSTVGQYTIYNGYEDDVTGYFTNVEKKTGTLTVNAAEATVTTGSDSKAYDGAALTRAEASITGLVGGETATVTATGTITDVGTAENTYTIEWGSAKAGNYIITENLGTLEVTPNNALITLTAGSAEKTYDGTPLTAEECNAEGLPAGMFCVAEIQGSQTDAGSSLSTVGQYTIYNSSEDDVTAWFTNVEKKTGTLTVNAAEVTVTTEGSEKVFDNQPLTNPAASITGLVGGDTATVTATGSIRLVGEADNTYAIDWGSTNRDNYTVREALGKLVVTPDTRAIVVYGPWLEAMYEGETIYADDVLSEEEGGLEIANLPEGFYCEADLTGSLKDVGEVAVGVTNIRFYAEEDGEDVTSCFTNVSPVEGKLYVVPAEVTVTTGSNSKEYDGTALTEPTASFDWIADCDRDEVTLAATGTITNVGNTPNTYSIAWGNANPLNYSITDTLGTLTVSKNTSANIIVTPKNADKYWDGEPLTCDQATVTGVPSGFTYEVATESEPAVFTEPGDGVNKVASFAIYKDGEDVTGFFENITPGSGTLKIYPAKIVLDLHMSAEYIYDGWPYFPMQVTVANQYGVSGVTVNRTQTMDGITITGVSADIYLPGGITTVEFTGHSAIGGPYSAMPYQVATTSVIYANGFIVIEYVNHQYSIVPDPESTDRLY